MGNAYLSRIISFTFDYYYYIWLALNCVVFAPMCNVSGTGFYANHMLRAIFSVLICVFGYVKIMLTTLYQIDRHTGFEIEIEFLTASQSF